LEQFFKKYKKFNLPLLCFLSLCSLLQSCTTLDLTLPISDLESPQHQGRSSGFGIEYTGQNGQQIQLSQDPSLRPIATTTSNKNLQSIFITKPGINFYAWNRFTFTAGLIESKSPFFKMKASLLSGFREDGEAGRYHASVATEVSYQRAEKSGTQNGVGGASGFPWSGKSDLLNAKAGFSFGYQKWKRVTPFIGYNYQQFQTYGDITQTASGSDLGGKTTFQPEIGKIDTYGFGIDWKPAPTLYIMPQVLYYHLKWYNKETTEFGGSLKISFVPVQ
jgi:hypothetical protein